MESEQENKHRLKEIGTLWDFPDAPEARLKLPVKAVHVQSVFG